MLATGAQFVLLFAIACRADPVSTFHLELDPRVPQAVEPFAGTPQVSLVIRDHASGTSVHDLGAWTGTALTLPNVGPLDEAMVGVLVQTAGTDGSSYHAEAALAYGEAGPISLALEAEPASLSFVLPMVGRTGLLDNVDDGSEALYTAAATLADGTVLRFGGGKDTTSTSRGGNATAASTADLDDGDWLFEDVGGTADFDNDGAPDKTSAATATTFTVEGEEYVLVAGGRDSYFEVDSSRRAFGVFKPSTRTWVQTTVLMRVARSQHRALRMSGSGDVLIMGGVGPSSFNMFEIFDAEDWTTELGAETDVAPLGFAMTDLGTRGVLACGGGVYHAGAIPYTSAATDCAIIGLNGDVTATAPLPSALQAHAMSTLPDGKVLATGGTSEDCHYDESCFATDEAWIYDPDADEWTAAPTKLVTPRLQHAQVTMADGRVLVIGGVQGGGVLYPAVADPVECNEVYDPATGAFTVLAPCDAPPLGADPAITGDPERGWVVFEGIQDTGAGGTWYGVIGGGPDIR